MNKATNKQKKTVFATNRFDEMSAGGVIVWGSCACRDDDQIERTMPDNDGIRLPVATKVQQKSRRENK
jgi:hypothetical protein